MSLTREQARFRNEQLLRNLRYSWPCYGNISDDKLIEIYDEFAISEYYGNNDERLPEFIADWIDLD
jgi:hypothetical protein